MLVPAERFELPTNGLQNRCSTTELSRHGGWSAECKSSAHALKTPDARGLLRNAARGSGLPGTRPTRFPRGEQCLIAVGRNCAFFVFSAKASRTTLVSNRQKAFKK